MLHWQGELFGGVYLLGMQCDAKVLAIVTGSETEIRVRGTKIQVVTTCARKLPVKSNYWYPASCKRETLETSLQNS